MNYACFYARVCGPMDDRCNDCKGYKRGYPLTVSNEMVAYHIWQCLLRAVALIPLYEGDQLYYGDWSNIFNGRYHDVVIHAIQNAECLHDFANDNVKKLVFEWVMSGDRDDAGIIDRWLENI